jgi:hypothetical protein
VFAVKDVAERLDTILELGRFLLSIVADTLDLCECQLASQSGLSDAVGFRLCLPLVGPFDG